MSSTIPRRDDHHPRVPDFCAGSCFLELRLETTVAHENGWKFTMEKIAVFKLEAGYLRSNAGQMNRASLRTVCDTVRLQWRDM
jgi:hypothetical protein